MRVLRLPNIPNISTPTEMITELQIAKGKDVVNSKYYMGSVANMRTPREMPQIELRMEEEAFISGSFSK